MIATRFRTVAWVALVALAALGCYLVSLRVAAERAQVARFDRALLAGRQDIRDLTTELGTRGRLVQLERWNADVLALTAPKAGQYLAGQMQLASLATTPAPQAGADTPAAAALEPPAAVARVAYRPALEKAATRLVHQVSFTFDDGGDERGLIHRAALVAAAARNGVLLDAGAQPARP